MARAGGDSKLPGSQLLGGWAKGGQDFFLVFLERIFFVSAHQINIELSNSCFPQPMQFLDVRLCRT